jgi:hypothetical protein
MNELVIRQLFGPAGVAYESITSSVADELWGRRFSFMPEEAFMILAAQGPAEMMQQYWYEILNRAYWAAASNLLRHSRWLASCVRLYNPEPNFLGFAACLRGMIEAAADAYYSLRSVPRTLAEHHRGIRSALAGKARQVRVVKDLNDKGVEEVLMHFQFARRWKKGENVPPHLHVEYTTTYIRTIDDDGSGEVMSLYEELCQIAHPAADSLLWMAALDEHAVVLNRVDEETQIMDLCHRHSSALTTVQIKSVNPPLMILKALNRFGLPHLRTPSVETIDLRSIPEWRLVEKLFGRRATDQ